MAPLNKPPKRIFERGNVFFTLFAAVGMVGILGAGIMATMRGPLSTMVEVNRRTQAESEMSIASKLVLVEAVDTLANGGDCDMDGFVEPLEFKDPGSDDAPVGGGFIPDEVGSNKVDPWGTQYGYCSWDAGPVRDDAACGGAGQKRLQGKPAPDDSDTDYTVIAVISAGPDQEFQTTCAGGANPEVTKGAGSDDIVNSFTYIAATAASEGLWKIKSGDANTAQINKDIEAQGAKFSDAVDLTNASAQLKLGAASMVLPTQIELPDNSCNMANNMLVRINTATTPISMEVCNGSTNTWVNVAEGASNVGVWKLDGPGGLGGEIYYNGGNVGIGTNDPDNALDVVGNIRLTEDLKLENGKSVVWTSGAAVTEGSGGLAINANGGAGVELSIDANSVDIIGDTTIKGSTSDGTKKALEIFDSSSSSILAVLNDGHVGIGTSNPDDSLSVVGYIDTDNAYKIDDMVMLNGGSGWPLTILLGANAGSMTTGDGNTILGAAAAATLTSGSNNIVIGSNTTGVKIPNVPTATTSNYLNIGNAIHGDLFNKRIGIGFADNYNAALFDDALEVNGNIDASNNIRASGDITAGDDITASGDITGTDIYATSQIFVDGDKLGPAMECTSSEKLVWENGSGWSCITDLQGGSGGGAPDLADVLGQDNDAEGLSAENFNQVGANQFCSADLSVCFDPADGTTITAPGNSREVIFNNSGVLGTDTGFVYTATDRLGIGTATPAGSLHVITGAGNGGIGWRVERAGSATLDAQIDGANNAWIGTTTNSPLQFFTNNGAPRMTIAANGQIGIGDTTPSGSLYLDVEGPVGAVEYCDENGDNCFDFTDIGDAATPALSAITAAEDDNVIDNADWNQAWNWELSGAETGFNFGESTPSTGGANDQYILGASTLATSTAIPFRISNLGVGQSFRVDDETADTTPFVIDAAGQVGIGTASPASILNIVGNQNGATLATIQNNNNGTGAIAGFSMSSDTASGMLTATSSTFDPGIGSAFADRLGLFNYTGAGLAISALDTVDMDADIRFFTQVVERMIIDKNGKIGIGTSAPQDLLHVSGTSGSIRTRVESSDTGGYAASVFENDNRHWEMGVGGSAVSDDVGNKFYLWDDAASAYRMVFDAAGNVAIGETTADDGTGGGGQVLKLDVEGPVGASYYCDQNGLNCFQPGSISGGLKLNSIVAADGNASINNGANNIVWNWQLAAAETGFKFAENVASTGGSGDQYILEAATLGTSTAIPLRVQNLGVGQSLRVDDEAGDTTPFVIDASGNMGVGTASPSGKAEITGELRLSDAIGDNDWRIYRDSGSGNLFIAPTQAAGFAVNFGNNARIIQTAGSVNPYVLFDATGSHELLKIDNTGKIYFGASPLGNSPDVQLYRSTTSTLRTNGNFIADSKVGINTTTISDGSGGGGQALRLDVEGAVGATHYCDKDGLNCFVPSSGIGVPKLNSIIAADGNATIANGSNNIIWNWQLAGAETGFTFGETTASGTGSNDQFILAAKTLSGSTATPFYIQNIGNGQSFRVDDASGDTTPFVIDAAGLVGIGTASPNRELQVVGRASVQTATGLNVFINGGNGTLTGTYNTALGIGTMNALTSGNYSTAVGYNALNALTDGLSNVSIGYLSLESNTQGNYNVAVGNYALNKVTTATQNTAVGTNALRNNTAGGNTALGYQTLFSNVGGTGNVGVGYFSLYTNVSGNSNTAVGNQALQANTASDNTALGYQSLLSNTSGTSNVAVGKGALSTNTTGNYNTGLGVNALNSNAGGDSNTAVGMQTLMVNTSGTQNQAFGLNSLRFNTTGADNSAYGLYSLFSNTTGLRNVALGNFALNSNTTSSNSVGIGYYALYSATGANNIALGYMAGDSLTTGHDNILIGYGVDAPTASTNEYLNIGNILFGDIGTTSTNPRIGAHKYCDENLANCFEPADFAGGVGAANIDELTDAYAEYASTHNLIMGRTSAAALTAGAQYNVFVGEGAGATSGNSTATTDSNTAVGYNTLMSLTSGGNSTAMGFEAMKSNTSGGGEAFGWKALNANTSGSLSSAFGAAALMANTTGNANVAVGASALTSNTTGANNTAVGAFAGYNTSTGSGNSTFGVNSMIQNTTGEENAAFGYFTMFGNTTGNHNSAYGSAALQSVAAGNYNVGIGSYAGAFLAGGSNNVYLGRDAGRGVGGSTNGSNNVMLGAKSGLVTTTAANNVYIGYQAADTATTGTNNIVIGYDEDVSGATVSNYMNIGGVLFGDLDTTNDPRIGSYAYCDEALANCFTADDIANLAVGVGADTELSDIVAASTNATITSGANNITWNWLLTGAETGMTFGEGSGAPSTGGSNDQYILGAKTVSSSTAIPLYVQNLGNGNSFRVDDATADTSPFVISNDGNVGVGNVSTPYAKVSVSAPFSGAYDTGSDIYLDGVTASTTFNGTANGNYYPVNIIGGNFYANYAGTVTDDDSTVVTGVSGRSFGDMATNYSAHVGVQGSASGAADQNIGVAGNASGSSMNVGLYGAGGSNSGVNRGLWAVASQGTSNYAIYTDATTAAGANNYSIYSGSPAKSYFAGNVGIGTTTPAVGLDVVANVSEAYAASVLNSANTGYGLKVQGGGSENNTIDVSRSIMSVHTGDGNTIFRVANGGQTQMIGNGSDKFAAVVSNTGTYGRGLQILSGPSGTREALDVKNAANDSLMVVLNNGNVGIGTNAPGSKLHVHVATDKNLRIDGATISGNPALQITAVDDSSAAIPLIFAGSRYYFNGDVALNSSAYINFGSTLGSTGYGIRDNAGTIECKNSGGAWAACAGGGVSIGDTITSATQGSVLFAGASGALAQDNANFFWDDTNNRLGLGTATPANPLDIVKSQDAVTQLSVTNPNTGTNAMAAIGVYSDTVIGGISASSSTFTGIPSRLILSQYTGAGMSVMADNADDDATMDFYVNTIEAMTIDASGNINMPEYLEVENNLHVHGVSSSAYIFRMTNDSSAGSWASWIEDGAFGGTTGAMYWDGPSASGGFVMAPNGIGATIGYNPVAAAVHAVNTVAAQPGLLVQGAAAQSVDLAQFKNSGGTTLVRIPSAGNIGLAASSYLNFGATDGSTGYGIRDNAGTIECKNSGGSWAACAAAGGSTNIDGLTDAYAEYASTHNLIMGRTSAAALTAGAVGNVFIGENSGATSANSTAATDGNTAVGYYSLAALTSGSNNTAFGYNSLAYNTSGVSNAAFGKDALYSNTTGEGNVAVGETALFSNTTGAINVAIGQGALNANTDGVENVAIGPYALQANTSGTVNIAIGSSALTSATTANGNVAIGANSQFATTVGYNNTSIGSYTMVQNTTGEQNVAVGANALSDNTTGNTNTAVGTNALLANTAGEANVAMGYNALNMNTIGELNVGIGSYALYSNTSGERNAVLGDTAMQFNTTGSYNSALGRSALGSNSTGNSNVAIGYAALDSANANNNIGIGMRAGDNITSGANNIIIGHDIDAPSATGSGQMSIGNLIYATGLSATGTTVSTGRVGIGTSSPLAQLSLTNGSQSGLFTAAQISLGYGGTNNYSHYIHTRHNAGVSSNNAIDFYTSDGTQNGIFPTNAVLGMSINGGKVGIGTSAPDAKLHVISDSIHIESSSPGASTNSGAKIVFDEGIALKYNKDLAGQRSMQFVDGSNNVFFKVDYSSGDTFHGTGKLYYDANAFIQPYDGTSLQKFVVYNTAGRSWVFQGHDGSEAMRITTPASGGNVGIGDPTPDHKLDVDGNIGMTAGGYLNFGDMTGTTGYGIRDNAGTIECKNSGGSWAACAGGGGAPAISALTAATAGNTIDNAAYGQVWRWQLTGSGQAGLRLSESAASTGGSNDQAIFNVVTTSGSTAIPAYIANFGNAQSFRVDDETGDTTPFVIDASGNVGIGTSTPASKLDVVGTASISGQTLIYDGTATSPGLGFISDTDTGLVRTGANAMQLMAGGQYTGLYVEGSKIKIGWGSATVTTGNDSGVVTFHSGGYADTVAITGGLKISSNANYGYITNEAVFNSNPTNFLNYSTAGTYATFATNRFGVMNSAPNAGQAITITDNATVKIDGAPTVSGGVTQTNAHALWVVGGQSVFGGNVGIGTKAPGSALDVKGTLRLSGSSSGYVGFAPAAAAGSTTYTLPAADGSNGYVLSTNGSGTLSWAAAAAGATDIDGLSDAFADYATNDNLIMGRPAAAALTSGAQYNVFVGESAGATSANSTANTDANTALGHIALSSLTSGSNNTALGKSALQTSTTGGDNTAVGSQSLAANTTGSYNTSVGSGALFNNKAKGMNTAIGRDAMYYADNTTSASNAYNTAIGYRAYFGSTTASDNIGINNTAMGASSLLSNKSGSSNTAVGVNALSANTSGGNSVAIGASALVNNTSGAQNIALGYQAGDNITTGSNNLIIGYNIDAPSATADGQMSIGNLIYATGLSATGTTVSTGKVGIGTASPAYALDVNGLLRASSTSNSIFGNGVTGGIQIGDGTITKTLSSNFQVNSGITASGELLSTGGNIRGTGENTYLSIDNGADRIGLIKKSSQTGKVAYGSATDFVIAQSSGTSIDTSNTFTDRFVINSSGNVGIGDPTPDHKLDVDGNIGMTAGGYLNFGDTTGTSGYGVRDNAGTIECKNSGGAWAACAGGGGGTLTGAASNATMTTFTQTVANNAANISTDYVNGNYIPGLVWSTTNDNATKPKMGIWGQLTGTGSNMYLGTSDSYVTGITKQMTIAYNGNVGIGTTTPTTAKLVINGAAATTGLDLATADNYAEMRVIRNSLYSGDKDMYIQYQAGSGSKIFLYSNNVQTMTLVNGNVGIGAGGPTFPLVVTKTAVNRTGNWNDVAQFLDGSGNKGVTVGYDSSGQVGIVAANSSSAASGLAFWSYNGSAWGERMRVHTSGNVGIGTNAPTASLDVTNTGSQPPADGVLRVKATGNSALGPLFQIVQTGNANNYMQLTKHDSSNVLSVDQNSEILARGQLRITGEDSAPNNNGTWSNPVGSPNYMLGKLNTGNNAPSFVLTAQGLSTTNASGMSLGALHGYVPSTVVSTGGSTYGVLGRNDSTSTYNYGVAGMATGAGTNNYGGYFSASGATNNYALITGSGNVGIGTSAPTSKLQVEGTTSLYNSGTGQFSVGTSTQKIFMGMDTASAAFPGISYIRSSYPGCCFVPMVIGTNNLSIGAGNALPDSNATVLISNAVAASSTYNMLMLEDTSNSSTPAYGTAMAFKSYNIGVGGQVPTGRIVSLMDAGGYANARLTLQSPTALNTWTDTLNVKGGFVGIRMTNPSVELDVTGDIEYTGTITDVSDIRLKKDIKPLDAQDVISRLNQINTYSFRMKADKKNQLEMGVIAQEMEKIFPELVRTSNDDMGTKSVNYVGLIAPLVEASKTLKSENDTLKAEVAKLQAEQAEMKTSFNDIAKDIQGLKAHTNYGVDKAQIGILLLVGALGGAGVAFIGRRRKKA